MVSELLRRLGEEHRLSLEEYRLLVEGVSPETAALARTLAQPLQKAHYQNKVFIRGLIEIGNVCKNDCYYCGIRRSNQRAERYRLSPQEILACCEEGYRLGFRTFVLQGGEGSPEELHNRQDNEEH